MQVATPDRSSTSRQCLLRALILNTTLGAHGDGTGTGTGGGTVEGSPYRILVCSRGAAVVALLLEAMLSHVLLRAHAHRGDVQVKPTQTSHITNCMYVYVCTVY